MLFTSYEFIAFIFTYFVLYYIIPKKAQWVLLLIASYGFYFSAGTFYPLFLLAATIITYTAAICIENAKEREKVYLKEHAGEFAQREEKKAFKKKEAVKRRRMMQAGLLLCLLMLGVFKYADFVVDNINSIFVALNMEKEFAYPDLLLPMGISFYTFQSISYLLDVYWGKTKAQRNFFKYMLFVSFFPQLMQGPISRYSNLSQTLYEEHDFQWKQVSFGLERMLWGYFKKMVVADTILTATMTIIGDEYYTGAWVMVGLIFYSIQLYADFTGGIDITIGIAQVFGIKVEENFIRPYFSKSIAEYWRRWHISMGTWFRDYVFYPLSMSNTMNHLTKNVKKHFGKGAARRFQIYTVTLITWLATGIWHAASWNFVMWGLMNGLFIVIAQEFEPLFEKFHQRFPGVKEKSIFRLFQIVRTFVLLGILQVFECYSSISMSFSMLFSMFADFDLRALTLEEFSYLGLTVPQYIVVAIGVVLMILVSLAGRSEDVREKLARKPYIVRYGVVVSLLFAVLLFGSYGIGYDSAQFIYNQY